MTLERLTASEPVSLNVESVRLCAALLSLTFAHHATYLTDALPISMLIGGMLHSICTKRGCGQANSWAHLISVRDLQQRKIEERETKLFTLSIYQSSRLIKRPPLLHSSNS